MSIQYIYQKSIDSTNNEIKRRLASGGRPEEYTVISAGTQTAGRGRIGHEWSSPADVSVATSMVLYPKVLSKKSDEVFPRKPEEDAKSGSRSGAISEECVPQLTIVAAMAVAYAVEELYGLAAQIKWVNDILLSGKKICGILTERVDDAVVVGIGVNVYPGSFPPELAEQATCIADELEKQNGIKKKDTAVSRKRLTEKIWQHFLALYEQFLQNRSLSFLLDEYNARLVNAGRMVRVMDPAGPYEAKALSMDENGRLVVETEAGGINRIDSGEVHVRGQNGYV